MLESEILQREHERLSFASKSFVSDYQELKISNQRKGKTNA